MQHDLSMHIFGFGCHLDEKLKRYLDRAVQFCKVQYPRFVVFSGGPTQQRTAPGKTEAQVMYDYVVPRCPELEETTWLTEANSFTTLESIWHTRDMLEERTEPGRLLTYTDASRTLKVRLCAYRHMPEWRIIQETYDRDSNPLSQAVSFVLEGLMIFVPPLHKPWSLYRRGWKAKRI